MKKVGRKMKERLRKSTPSGWSISKCDKAVRRRRDKLRLRPFHPINGARRAPREQNKDDLIKSESPRTAHDG